MPSEEHKYYSVSAVPTYQSASETSSTELRLAGFQKLELTKCCITTKIRKSKLLCVSFPTLYPHLCWDMYLYGIHYKKGTDQDLN